MYSFGTFIFRLDYQNLESNILYYVNTNEIPGELSCENLISSHVKITCYLKVARLDFFGGIPPKFER